jgi:homoserine O-acetyltransferase
MNFSITRPETKTLEIISQNNPFRMESGSKLGPITMAYETYGLLNDAGDNAVLLCHALTGSADVAGASSGWWKALVGPGRCFDTDRSFVICSNILGSCYGTTGPSSTDHATGQPYGLRFPTVTVRDMVRLQHILLKKLGVNSLRTVAGGSLGGMQVLEWALMFPEMVRSIIPIATAARHSAWCIGLDDIGRQAILNDPDWRGGDYYEHSQPKSGLSLARQIAMVSYRSDASFADRFERERVASAADLRSFRPLLEKQFQVESYLRYQGDKLVQRFDANSYLYITRAMDLHDVGLGRGGWQQALSTIRIPTLCIGIDTDILYPAREQQEIASSIPHASYREIRSRHGHDAFLIEFEQLTGFIVDFFEESTLS